MQPSFLSGLVRSAFGRGLEHVQAKWIGFAVENATEQKTRGDFAQAEAAPESLTPSLVESRSDAPPQLATHPDGDWADAEAALPEDFDPGLVEVLADKILLAWLRNRYQLLFPFAFDLRRLDARQTDLLVHAMLAAAQADGSFDEKERQRIETALSLAYPDGSASALMAAALEDPKPLNAVLNEARDVQTGALVYTASLLAIDQRKPVNRQYLRYLAARLQLSEELVASLEQRFRSPA